MAIEFDKTILIAFDYDGTLTKTDDYSIESELDKKAIKWLRKIQKLPVETILWTCRHDEKLDYAVKKLKKNGIDFNYINDDNHLRNSEKKINVDFYIDDKANDGKIRWSKIYKNIKKLIKERK